MSNTEITSKYPSHWVECRLGDVITLVNGRAYKKQEMLDAGTPILRIQNLNGKENWFYSDLELPDNKYCEYGDLLYAWSATFGPYWSRWKEKVIYHYHIWKVLPSDAVTKKFAFYELWRITEDLKLAAHGVAMPHITKGGMEGWPIVLPPLNEQTRIANKLDELLAQVDTIKARIDAIPTILKRFRQSVLAAAVSGKLTEEWRGQTTGFESSSDLKIRWLKERESKFISHQSELVEKGKQKRVKKFKAPVPPDIEFKVPSIPDDWELISVSEFADCLDGQRVPVKKELRESAQGLYPYFGANGEVDKVDDYIFDCELVLVTEDETFYGRTKPIAYRYSDKCWVNNHVHALSAPTKVANDFLCFALMYYDVIPWLTGTTGRAKLTQGALNSLPIGLPPEEEQEQIVQRVEQLFAFADQIEQRVKEAQARIDNLSQSILAKAFRGELVPQDPNDEPASELLERIKQEREAAAKLAKAAKKVGKRK